MQIQTMKNKNLLYEFELHIYPRKLWVAVDCSNDYLKQYFDEVIPLDITQYTTVYDTGTKGKVAFGGIIICFWYKKYMSVENIAHESTHAALEVFDYIGSKVDLKNQEYLAYLIGYIAKCLDQVKNGNVKNGKLLK